MEPWKHILAWRLLLNHAKRDVNLHDFWTETTSLKPWHISHRDRFEGGGKSLSDHDLEITTHLG